MTFTAEQLVTIVVPLITVLGGIMAAWGYSIQQRAKATATERVNKADSERDQAKADADTKVKAADAKLIEVQSQAKQQEAILDLFKGQQAVNEKLQTTTEARDAETKLHYSTLRGVQNEMGRDILKLQNTVEAGITTLSTAIENLPARVQIINVETLKAFAQEVGVSFAQQLSLQRFGFEMLPFPDAEDPGWQTVTIMARAGMKSAKIWKQPAITEDTVLRKPCATIAEDGERVKIIRGRVNNWLAIYKPGKESDCWGWVEESKVQIVEDVVVKPEPQPAVG